MSIQEEHIYTLTELNTDIRATLEDAMSQQYWVCAEISELHHNRNGHCYLELIDKDTKGRTTARQRAVIWSNTFNLLRPYFEQETGQAFVAGIKVLVLVTVTYHELFYEVAISGSCARRHYCNALQQHRHGQLLIIVDNTILLQLSQDFGSAPCSLTYRVRGVDVVYGKTQAIQLMVSYRYKHQHFYPGDKCLSGLLLKIGS